MWRNGACFNDITQGDNGAYQALLGPDPCTGIGSPVGIKIAALFGATAGAQSLAPHAASTSDAALAFWSGKVVYTYVNGVLAAPPEIMPSIGVELLAPRPLSAVTGTFTVLQGRHYTATVTLNGLEQLASNDTIKGFLEHVGFTQVSVTGSGGTRQARGLWPGPDTTAQLDSRLSNMIDEG